MNNKDTKNQILADIKATYSKNNLFFFFFVIFGDIVFMKCLYDRYVEFIASNYFNILSLLLMGIDLFIILLITVFFIRRIIISINPKSSDIIKKYGSVDYMESIIISTNISKIYENDNIVISNTYIYNKNNLKELFKCDEICNINIYKYIYRDINKEIKYKIYVRDKSKETGKFTFFISPNEKEEIINNLKSVCKKANVTIIEEYCL